MLTPSSNRSCNSHSLNFISIRLSEGSFSVSTSSAPITVAIGLALLCGNKVLKHAQQDLLRVVHDHFILAAAEAVWYHWHRVCSAEQRLGRQRRSRWHRVLRMKSQLGGLLACLRCWLFRQLIFFGHGSLVTELVRFGSLEGHHWQQLLLVLIMKLLWCQGRVGCWAGLRGVMVIKPEAKIVLIRVLIGAHSRPLWEKVAPLSYLLRLLALMRLLLRLRWSICSRWGVSHSLSWWWGGNCDSVGFLLLDCDEIIRIEDGSDVEYMRETLALKVVSRFCIILKLKSFLFGLCSSQLNRCFLYDQVLRKVH